jgi:ribosomal protein S18 acetylase RimI-like enzyme
MSEQIERMRHEDVPETAALVAARQRALRAQSPALPAAYEDPAAVAPLIERLLGRPRTDARVARAGGRVTGFLVGARLAPSPFSRFAGFLAPRSVAIAAHGHAAAGPDPVETYRRLYAAAAGAWVRAGYFEHGVEVIAGDEGAGAAWFSLGFGQSLTLMARPVTPPSPASGRPPPAMTEVHRAGVEDVDVVMGLVAGLAQYHAQPPMLLPDIAETRDDWRDFKLGCLADADCADWVAYQGGQAVGLQSFHPPHFDELLRPERATYLFEGYTEPEARGRGVGELLLGHALAHAHERGHEWCTLHVLSANVGGRRFWSRQGFHALSHRLVRRVDERIAWADGSSVAQD